MKIDEFKPGIKLDALIAEKVMGWRWIERPYSIMGDSTQTQHKALFLMHQDVRSMVFDSKPLGVEKQIPQDLLKYSTDIAAAFEVVEKIHNLPEKPVIHIQKHLAPGLWMVLVYWPIVTRFPAIIGKTAPHAICLAALRAVLGKDTIEE